MPEARVEDPSASAAADPIYKPQAKHSPASRSASQIGRYMVLDAARGVAALCVMIYHLKEVVGDLPLFRGSFLAVDLFFLMSGIVVARAYESRLLDKRMSYSRFVLVRVVRLYPLYLAACFVGASYFLSKVALKLPDAPSSYDLVTAAPSILLVLPAYGSEGWGFGPFPFAPSAWSLSLELWFNFAFAACLPWLSTRALIAVAAASFLVLCQQAWTFGSIDLGWGIDNLLGGAARFWFSFTMGVLIFRTKLLWKTPHPLALLALPIAFVFIVFPRDAIALQLFWVAVVFPIFTVLTANLVTRGLTSSACDHLGRLSYGIYILHAPLILWMLGVMKVVHPTLPSADPAMVGIGMVGAILVASAVLTYMFDEPVRLWLGKRFSQSASVKRKGASLEARDGDPAFSKQGGGASDDVQGDAKPC